MIKQTHRLAILNDSGVLEVVSSATYQAPAAEQFSDVVAHGDTLELDLPVDVTELVAFYIHADRDVKLNTNAEADGDAAQSFDLAAKVPLWWNTDRADANPLTTPITKLFFINSGTSDANVKGAFLVDAAAP